MTAAITSQDGAGTGEACPLLQILLGHQLMATAWLLEAGQLPLLSELSGFSHHDPDRWVGRVPKCHLTPWRGQSARPAWSRFSLLAFLVAWYFHAQQCSGLSKDKGMTLPFHLQLTLPEVSRVSWSAVSVLIKLSFPPGHVLHLFICFPIISHGDKSSSSTMRR